MVQTKTNRIYNILRDQIKSGELGEGTKLMSLRRAVEQFGASKNTMVAVYDLLVANGLVHSRHGAGFFVAHAVATTAEPANLREARDSVSLLRAQLDRPYTVLVGDGRPPESWLLNSAPSVSLATGEGGYGTPHGLATLREYVAASHFDVGISVSPNQIVTTFGANHALDLVIRRFCRPGETVLVDDPGYYPLFAKLKLAGVNVIGIPRGPHGPDCDALDSAAKQHSAHLFFTQSLAQNPTGFSIDLPIAHSVLKVAERHNMLIVDDDPFIDVPGISGTRLASLDFFHRVIQIGTFSKVLTPTFRSGYIIAEPGIAQSLAELKMVLTVNSSSHTERLIANIMRSGRYKKQCQRLSKRLAMERNASIEHLKRIGFNLDPEPIEGLYGWLPLPTGASDIEVAKAASEQGIFLAPGSLFRVEEYAGAPAMRVNWSRVNDSRFYTFLRSLF
ncbi:PLP-dependent aminotransferase family protein [Celeribacter halophilus]|uniref:Transcriptional regulator, GntR family n=1 Tax=Celeribacter halophilus TaxID=576117 RepID=A0A1I3WT25_9RHOB|nr:PLP-dependent aminotransferase family protein [Celeribacter halophilus]PZX06030.1 GntR family transcriptional regulator [Celeribacter halophilus]SFK09997.1 transcriptional regulator, GntR family [Celeribacter halophilus]